MALNCGIIGLPNVGKSTIFSALTAAPAEAANYPFCTIDANIGIVDVPDKRLDDIYSIFQPPKKTSTSMEFVDIAGLVEGASKGEGLGNKFLANIREVNAIVHVVRCFEDGDISHVYETIDPVRDIETINYELSFADLDSVEKRLEKLEKKLKIHDKDVRDKALKEKSILKTIQSYLSKGKPARLAGLSKDEKKIIKSLNLLTLKKVLYVCNVSEEDINTENEYVKKVKEYAQTENAEVLALCGKTEAEIMQLEDDEEKEEFMKMLNIDVPGLNRLIKKAYHLLDLRTFFTAGEKEVRAWPFKKGIKAPEAAGVIHSDFERGFIKAEVYNYDDFMKYKSEKKLRKEGLIRMKGKNYIVKDGDIIYFRFNV